MSTISRIVVAICLAAFTVQFSNPVFVKQLAAAEIGSITNDRNARQPNQKKKSTPKENTGPRYAVQVPEPTVRNIPYGDHSRQILDFWRASQPDPTPLVFVIHGGGWKGGSKERLDRFVDINRLLKAGISVVAINYRFVTQADPSAETPPVHAPLHDAARALQFVRSKAKEWNLDKTRVGAAGGSAGACSSLWLAFHDDLKATQNGDQISAESTRLQAAAVIGAQTTLDPKQMREWTPNSKYGAHAFGIEGGFDAFYKSRAKIINWIEEYSPYALVSQDDPPVALFYNAPPNLGKPQKDPTHTSNFGVKLKEHCESTGTVCELIHPGAKSSKYPTATDFLIETLTNKGK